MKQWQKEKLHSLLDLALTLNRHCWIALTVGGLLVIAGWIAGDGTAMLTGFILVALTVGMITVVDIILRYVRWRKKTWK
ncbi:MAG: hypothetical protein WBC82_11160 [Dehalococcoidia bacterium]